MAAATVDEHLAALPADRRAVMEAIRSTIRAAAPDAEEVITYNMPGFKVGGRFLVSYESFKAHYSLFPASDEIIARLGERIAPYLAGRGTIRFPAKAPVPLDVVRAVTEIRVEMDAKEHPAG